MGVYIVGEVLKRVLNTRFVWDWFRGFGASIFLLFLSSCYDLRRAWFEIVMLDWFDIIVGILRLPISFLYFLFLLSLCA